MKNILQKIIGRAQLTKDEAYQCMLAIGNGELHDAQTVAVMAGIQMRGLQLDELNGFREALLELALPMHFDIDQSIDVCGTGGDGKNTFNISTSTAFVLASMGYKVVKHGNYGVSSLCGSSNVLESLGYTFTNNKDVLQRQLDHANICFMHAPLFHPALKAVAPLRKALGIATFFNSMGPLVNPAHPTHQLSGTYSLELAKQYQHVLRSDRENFTILHGMDGFDELTFIGATRILGKERDEIINNSPKVIGIALQQISGGNTVKDSATILVNVLQGKGTEPQNIVLAGNVALALQTFDPEKSFETAFAEAHEAILTGRAIDHLKKISA
ncbi:anthranilate phosphoribosyltransferase [Flavobacterium sp. Sd200]|uniref:anthranilate phosphoribosyltransferase n=1 Tax=Flavobacterium sp. Sd200 TaxID=2692211 RepID=UPI00136DF76D|nr:anthranilate phosphoribosyltransferase [Flavobacterium sp. Sd200]MXN89966.1 anthranilate phosphoribosyltransferase [Flavobacterium sp. Sd200]